jgi:nucleotide-binding universal stress UspA family protein
MKILVAVENYKYAKAQVDFIANHKWPQELTFHVFHAAEPVIEEVFDDKGEHLFNRLADWRKEQGIRLVNNVASDLRSFFPEAVILETVECDYAKEAILDLADQWQADLIIVGAHGRSMKLRAALGSVSNTILTHANCSVMVVRPPRVSSDGFNPVPEEETVSRANHGVSQAQ